MAADGRAEDDEIQRRGDDGRDDGLQITYTFDSQGERTGIASLLRRLADHGIAYTDLHTSQSSLEDIFVSLVHQNGAAA